MCSCPTKSEPSKSRPTVYLIFVADVDQYHYTGARPYMDEPLKQLVKPISRLRNLRPAKSVGVPLADIATPLWLPSSVKVYVESTTHDGGVDEFCELSYRNENCYTDN